jgi:ribonuclease-3
MEKVIAFMHQFLGDDSEFKPEELELYKLALTHSSNNTSLNHNQRLAFLGDAVLHLIIREKLYKQHLDWDKGKLTEVAGTDKTSGLETDENYAKIAIDLKIIEYMDIQNRAFELDSITPNAEVFEALFGAVYLARGLEEARRVALKYIDFESVKKIIG